MNDLFDKLFIPPPMPPVDIPLPQRLSRPILQVIKDGYGMAFRAGWSQGFLFGFMLALAIVLGLTLRLKGNRHEPRPPHLR